jgi:transposase
MDSLSIYGMLRFMKTQTAFRPYNPDQLLLLPPDMSHWLPQEHLVYFIRDVVGQMDLSAIYGSYDGSKGGNPAYHPEMMVALLIYAYCVGVPSSRKLEKATYELIPFRVLTADQHPDHDTIAEFRRRHLEALAALFIQVLCLCQKAGLVKLGHVSLDGTKVRANASKHKAMSYARMERSAVELEAEVKRLLAEAEATDEMEDSQYGKDRHGDELPEELWFKQGRLAKIKEAKEILEREARERADQERLEQEKKRQEREASGDHRGRPPKAPSEKPAGKTQYNFTDPESRIMKDGATKSFEQSYNCQAAVDGHCQVIVATGVSQEANDKGQLKPMVERLKANLEGSKPGQMSTDSGYFSEENVTYLAQEQIDGYVATGRIKHRDQPLPAPQGRIPKNASLRERMSRKLRTLKGRAIYARRKEISEPVFGQIKQVRGFRQFLLRGLRRVSAEWDLICLGHNMLKLFRSNWRPATV